MAMEQAEGADTPDPVHRIQATRAALRDAAGVGEQHDAFPRSAVLQVALSPRYRWITAALATAVVVAVWRKLPGRRIGLLLGAASLVRSLRHDPMRR